MVFPIKDKIKNLNIVIGCPIGCRYCYARSNCRRFHITDDFSKPQFFENKLRLFDTKEPKVFLLTGMSDLAYWQFDWTEKVFEKAAQTPHNQYLFLTKHPERLNIQTDLDNLWFGVTVTCAAERKRMEILRRNVKAKHYHVTFEPLSDGVGEVDFRASVGRSSARKRETARERFLQKRNGRTIYVCRQRRGASPSL